MNVEVTVDVNKYVQTLLDPTVVPVKKDMLLEVMEPPARYRVEEFIVAAKEAFTHQAGRDSILWTSAANGSSTNLMQTHQ